MKNPSKNSIIALLFNLALVFIFTLLTPSVSLAQPSEPKDGSNTNNVEYEVQKQQFDRGKWKKEAEKLKYTDPGFNKKRNIEMPNLNLGWLKNVLIGLFIVLIVALLIWLLKGANFAGSKKVEEGFSIKEFLRSEGESQYLNIEAELQKARLSGNYVLAIRYMYLQIIAWLSTRGDIKWKKDKTNNEYYYELKSHQKPFEEFLFFTKIYEHTWFGKKFVNQSDFNQVDSRYLIYGQSIRPSPEKK